MKPRLSLAFALLLAGVACHPARVKPPVVMAQPEPQIKKENTAEKIAQRKKAEMERSVKVRQQAKDAVERGRERLRDEQNGEALVAFQEAVRLDHQSVDAWIRIAYVYEQEGDMARASEAFREVKRLWAM
ncbi:MAG: hypothetical protein WCO60_06625 [Verrucomicrobiota bacterium]